MNFLSKFLSGVAFIPAIVHGIEALFGHSTSTDKKSAAMSFASAAIGLVDAVASKDVVDQAKFEDGLSKVIDGVVACLNASSWAKK
jgi:hypothetical protein